MSGILPSDSIIKLAIELGMEDMRKQPWLVEHMLSEFVHNKYLKKAYGENQVKSCQEWFINNQIDVYLRYRKDKDKLPCVTITLGSSEEKSHMKTLGDRSTESILLYPNEIGKPIPYILKPFVPTNYDILSQTLYIPSNLLNNIILSPGMFLLNPSNGQAFVILGINTNGVIVNLDQKTIESATTLGIIPKYQFYKARLEHSFFQETYNVECSVHGDPSTLLWLHAIVLYSLMRYRESLLEAQGLAESLFSSTDLYENPNFQGPSGEECFSRTINITAQVENTVAKSPQRYIEAIAFREETPCDTFTGGITILSNLDSPALAEIEEDNLWTTKEESE